MSIFSNKRQQAIRVLQHEVDEVRAPFREVYVDGHGELVRRVVPAVHTFEPRPANVVSITEHRSTADLVAQLNAELA